MSHPTDSLLLNLDNINLADPDLYGKGDPHLVWHALRRRAPVYWQSVGDRLGFWSVTKYDDVEWVLKDHTTFTSQRGTLLNLLGVNDPAGGRQMAATDPPRHTRMRHPLQLAMNMQSVERHVDSIRVEVRRLLAPAATGEVFDFAAAMASLSTAVAGIMMGLPAEDWPLLTRLTTMAVAADDPEFQLPAGSKATLERAHRELFAYFQDHVSSVKNKQRDNLVSLLLTMEVEGRRLDPGEIVSNCYSLVLGANVTTPHVPSAALLQLIETDSYQDWADHPELINSGVEEALRWASPANHFMRYAVRDVELRGVQIREGEAVVAWLGSANRDEEVFEDPYRFDIRREPNRHVAFGAGPHYCIGHSAARQTLRILFAELFRHFDRFALAGPTEHLSSNFIAGIKHLYVLARPRSDAPRALLELH